MPQAIASYFERVRRDDNEEPALAGVADDPDSMRDVLTLLRVRTGHDFSNYKNGTVQRRIERRMHLRGISTIATYARMIRQEPDEAVSLMRELLISVTNFFRDGHSWTSFRASFSTRP
jgi:two-component system CheB/CheR fusion protein